MNFVYLAAPLSPIEGETVEGNIERAMAQYQFLCLEYPGIVFLCQWLLNVQVFEDTPEHRAAGMKRNKAIIQELLPEIGGQLWLMGPRISSGMSDEAGWAREVGVPVDDCYVGPWDQYLK
jgi:hypothetical protein